MNDNLIRKMILMSKKTNNPCMLNLHRDVESTIKTKSYDWRVVRVSQDGNVSFE